MINPSNMKMYISQNGPGTYFPTEKDGFFCAPLVSGWDQDGRAELRRVRGPLPQGFGCLCSSWAAESEV